MPKDFEEIGVLDHLGRLSSAEDIFTYLLLPYEEEVVNVSRLHIMKRFGAYLRDADFGGLDEEGVFLAARQVLKLRPRAAPSEAARMRPEGCAALSSSASTSPGGNAAALGQGSADGSSLTSSPSAAEPT